MDLTPEQRDAIRNREQYEICQKRGHQGIGRDNDPPWDSCRYCWTEFHIETRVADESAAAEGHEDEASICDERGHFSSGTPQRLITGQPAYLKATVHRCDYCRTFYSKRQVLHERNIPEPIEEGATDAEAQPGSD